MKRLSSSNSSRARARMSKVLLHLTSEPENVPPNIDASMVAASSHEAKKQQTGSSSGSIDQERDLEKVKRREMAYEAQKKRLKTDWGFEVNDESVEPIVAYASDEDIVHDVGLVQHQHGTSTGGMHSAAAVGGASNKEHHFRIAFEQLCHAASTLGVATDAVEDAISLKVPGQGFLVRPFGTRLEEIRAHELNLVPIGDLPDLHRDLYASRQDITCVINLRNADAELVSLTSAGLLPISQDAIRVLGQSRKADSDNLALRASRTSTKNATIWLVRNRGLVCCGGRMEDALATTVYAVRACAFQARAQVAVGGDMSRLDIPNESDAIRNRAELDARCEFSVAADAIFDRAKSVGMKHRL